jgi:hypothetical protein
MKEYIEREFIDNLLQKHLDDWWGPEYYATSIIKDEIDDIPSAEVTEVRHAYWKPMKAHPGEYVCSECGELWNNFLTPYCHECGAKMDGGKV